MEVEKHSPKWLLNEIRNAESDAHALFKIIEFQNALTEINKHRTMEKNEIKKALYKQSPLATFSKIRKGNAYYVADLENKNLLFEIPIVDMGDADFFPDMEAKLLIRWLVA